MKQVSFYLTDQEAKNVSDRVPSLEIRPEAGLLWLDPPTARHIKSLLMMSIEQETSKSPGHPANAERGAARKHQLELESLEIIAGKIEAALNPR